MASCTWPHLTRKALTERELVEASPIPIITLQGPHPSMTAGCAAVLYSDQHWVTACVSTHSRCCSSIPLCVREQKQPTLGMKASNEPPFSLSLPCCFVVNFSLYLEGEATQTPGQQAR